MDMQQAVWTNTPSNSALQCKSGSSLFFGQYIIIPITIFMVLSSWLRAVARVHPVHWMNVDSVLDGCQPSDQAKQLGL